MDHDSGETHCFYWEIMFLHFVSSSLSQPEGAVQQHAYFSFAVAVILRGTIFEILRRQAISNISDFWQVRGLPELGHLHDVF